MTTIPRTGLRRAAYLFVQSNPGCTSAEVAASLPDEKPGSVGAALSRLHHDGLLSRQKKGFAYRYFIAEPVVEPVAPQPLSDWERQKFQRMKFDLPDAELKLRRAEAELFEANARLGQFKEWRDAAYRQHARIQQLEQWRNAAIARYPDLDVDPALLAKAREIVMRTSDMTTADADEILAGEWDHTPIMRATLAALGSSVL